jgi:hypothetical protein
MGDDKRNEVDGMTTRVESQAAAQGGGVRGRHGDDGVRAFLLDRRAGPVGTILLVAAALSMVGSGLIHLYLWHTAYRHVATLGPLFLVQAVACIVLAVALAAIRRGVVVVAAIALMAGTIIGFILVTTVGLFGFTLHLISGWADLALATESAVIALALIAGVTLWRSHLQDDAP